jgi:hypothetical protein
MPPLNIIIPCDTHRECFFHKHHRVAASNETTDVPKTVGEPSKASDHADEHSFVKGDMPQSRIQRLPHELLLIVFEDLGVLDMISLALTCRAFFSILQRDAQLVTSATQERETAQTYNANDLLRRLVRDLGERYWHCEDCAILHPRSVVDTSHVGLLGKLFNVRNFFPSQHQPSEDSTFNIRIANSIIFALNFPTAQAAIDRHFQVRKGICLNALKCSGVHVFPSSDALGTGGRILRYTFEPKIILDRLLLKATYAWEIPDLNSVHAGHEEQPGSSADHSQATWQLEDTGLWICAHLNIVEVLEAAARHPLTREEVRCEKCPTQYWVQQNPDDTASGLTLVQVWHNLGSCRKPREERWAHMVSNGETTANYKWRKMSKLKGIYGDEDVRDAFEWICFSSRKAFVAFDKAKAGRDGHFHPDPYSKDGYRRRKRLPRSIPEFL